MGKQYLIWQKKLLVQSWPVRTIKINSNQWSECHIAKVFLLQCQGAQRQIPCAVKLLHLGKRWEMCAHPCCHACLRNNTGVGEEAKGQGWSFNPDGCRYRPCSALPRCWQLFDSGSWCAQRCLVQEVVLGG